MAACQIRRKEGGGQRRGRREEQRGKYKHIGDKEGSEEEEDP